MENVIGKRGETESRPQAGARRCYAEVVTATEAPPPAILGAGWEISADLFVRPIAAGRTLDDTVMVNRCQAGRNGPAARLSFSIFSSLFSVVGWWAAVRRASRRRTARRFPKPSATLRLARRATLWR